MNPRNVIALIALCLSVQSAHAAVGEPLAGAVIDPVDACRLAVDCTVAVSADGGPLLIEETVDPDASRFEGALPMALASGAGSPEEAEAFARGWRYSRDFGNSRFGAYMGAETALSYDPDFLGGTLRADAAARFGARLLGSRRALVEGRIAGAVNFRETPIGSGVWADVAVLGADVWGRNWPASGSDTARRSYSREFFAVSTRILLGPVPVALRAAVSGRASVDFGYTATSAGLTLEAEPEAGLDVVASARVEAGVARAGVRSTLTLFAGSLPMEASVALVDGAIEWGIEVQAALTVLSGRVVAFAELGFGTLSRRWSTVLARWSGTTLSRTLVSLGS